MKILGTKALKNTLNPHNSEKTTAINSETGSRKNSTFFEFSRDSQKILPSLTNLIPEPSHSSNKKNRKCLKITVNQNRSHYMENERISDKERKDKKSIFNFCQEVPSSQNFYSSIIKGGNSERLELGPRKELNLKKRMEIEVNFGDCTLTGPQSPINKLVKLEGEIVGKARGKDESMVEWERLLERV